MRCFKCHKFGHGKDKCRRPNSLCGRCGKEHADQHQCTAAAHCINCKGDHPAFSKQCPKFLEEQAILRYKAEHGGTFQQARAAVIVDTPRTVSSRTYAQATKLSLKSSKATQPKASDKVSASVTSKANAQRHTPPSSPKGAVSRPADKQGPANLRKKGPLGNQSIVLATCRTWTSTVFRTTSLTRGSRAPGTPVPWSAPSPSPNPSPNPRPDPDPASTPPPPHSPTHHIPPLIPPTADGDLIPVNSPPPPPARYPTSPQVVVRTGAGRAANGLRGPPKGDSQAKIIKLVKMDTENLVQWNIRGLRSNCEELKLLLNKTSTSVVALQDCKLGEERLSPRGYALLKGNCPAGEAALLINQRVVHTELTLNSTLHAVAATVTLNKTFTICSIYLTPGELSLNLAWKI